MTDIRSNIENEKKITKTFFHFLTEKVQIKSTLYLLLTYLFIYFILIYLYPYPDGISDSNGYIDAAIQGQYTGYRPFGYSEFLILLHNYSNSISFVVLVQFWLNAFSSILFIQGIKYLFKIEKRYLKLSLEFLSVFSITSIYLSNCLLSDSLFTSLTYFWILTGLGFIHTSSSSKKTIFFLIHLVLLGFLFSIRFTALFYLFITILFAFFALFKISKIRFLLFCLLPIMLIFGLYNKQTNTTEELTGVSTFSGFSGWQMANNAMHVVQYIKIDTNSIENEEVKKFTQFVIRYNKFLPVPHLNTTPEYIWTKEAALKKYLYFQLNENRNTSYLDEWTYLGKNVYSKFGTFIMFHYPIEYLRYYLLPNMAGVFYPRYDDVLPEYETNTFSKELIKNWFDIETESSFYSNSSLIGKVSKYLPLQRLILTIVFFLSIITKVVTTRKSCYNKNQNNLYKALIFFIISFMLFQSFAATCFIRHAVTMHIGTIAAIIISVNELFNFLSIKKSGQ